MWWWDALLIPVLASETPARWWQVVDVKGPQRTPSQIKVNQNENLVRPSLKNLSGFHKEHCILYIV